MSYGVMASKNGQLLVETRRVGDGGRTEAALARFAERRGRNWSVGRFTLTRLHLSYLPGASSRGAPALNIDLADIEGVEIGEGRVTKTVGIRTATHVMRFRCTGAPAFAQAVAAAAEEGRRAKRTTPRGPTAR